MKPLTALFLLATMSMDFAVCDYQLRVRIHSYLNPESRCISRTNSFSEPVFSCCDNKTNTGECTGKERCDTYFRYCLRPLGRTGAQCPVNDLTGVDTAFFSPDTDTLTGVGDSVFGTDNPIVFFGPQWMGFQFYLRSIDSDLYEEGGAQDIDSFAIDLSIEGGQRLEPQVYQGRFQIAQIELSFEVVCKDNFSLPDCSPCEPGSSEQCTDRQQAKTDPQSHIASKCTETGAGVIASAFMGAICFLMLICIAVLILQLLAIKRKQVWPKGAQGSAWPKGAQGSVWPKGAQGSVWPKGAQDSVWPKGAQGSVWPKGAQDCGQDLVKDIITQQNCAYESVSESTLEVRNIAIPEAIYDYVN